MTLVWVLGLLPVWLLGVVDYSGSRLLLLRPVSPSAEAVSAQLSALFALHGPPEALLSDNGGQFVSAVFADALKAHGAQHRRTRPAHPWTNGRIERLFRTFKRTMRLFVPVFVSWGHVRRCCDDFVLYYNRCRPHSACFGFTPGEVYADAFADGPFEAVELFDGRLLAHRFT